MSALRFLNIGIDHPTGRERASNPEAQSKVTLRLGTETGRIRDVELSRHDLVGLIAEAARALSVLEKRS